MADSLHQYDDIPAYLLFDAEEEDDGNEQRPRVPSLELFADMEKNTNDTTDQEALKKKETAGDHNTNDTIRESWSPDEEFEFSLSSIGASSSQDSKEQNEQKDKEREEENEGEEEVKEEDQSEMTDPELTDDEKTDDDSRRFISLQKKKSKVLWANTRRPVNERYEEETRRFFSTYRISRVPIQTSFCTSAYSKNDWRQITEVIKHIKSVDSDVFRCLICRSCNCNCTVYDLFSYAIEQINRNGICVDFEINDDGINRGSVWNESPSEKFLCKMYRSGLFMTMNKRPQILWHFDRNEYKTDYNECRKTTVEYNFRDDNGLYYNQVKYDRDELIKLDMLPKEFVNSEIREHVETNFQYADNQLQITPNKISRNYSGIFLKISPGNSHKTGEMSLLNGLYLPTQLPYQGFFKVFVRLYAPMLVCTLSTFMEDQSNGLHVDPAFRFLNLDDYDNIETTHGLSDNFVWNNNYMRLLSNFYTAKGRQTVHERKNATKRHIATGSFVQDNIGMKGIIGTRNRISVCISALCSDVNNGAFFNWEHRAWNERISPQFDMVDFKTRFCGLFRAHIKTFACTMCNFKEEPRAPNDCIGCRCVHCRERPSAFDVPWKLLTHDDITIAKEWIESRDSFFKLNNLTGVDMCIDCALMYIFVGCTSPPDEYGTTKKKKKGSKKRRVMHGSSSTSVAV